jgi:undecaprenyl-diphosphatase
VRGAAVIAAVAAAITAVITLRFLTRYFQHRNLIPFGLYCISFGAFMTVFIAVSGAP